MFKIGLVRPIFHLNSPHLKERRQELRNNAPEAEKMLWKKLKNSQLGCKFRRQYSVDGYVVDFYCPKFRLAIELDGKTHNKTQIYDQYRTRWLNAFNIKIVRFTNQQIFGDIDKIITTISSLLG